MTLQDAFDRFLSTIETELQEVVHPPHGSLSAYYGMMHYHLGWADERLEPLQARTGKRLRPMLCVLACQAAGGDPYHALPAAAAVELIHNFSLVHDDIQDSSHYRRGRRAVWDIWGAAQAINVGDGLFVLARLALHRLAGRGVPADTIVAAAAAFDRACMLLCEGQYFDMTFEDRLDVDLQQYLTMIRQKTAMLLATSTRLGAVVGTENQETVEHLARFGEHLGMAFQIQDDILGTWGDEQVTGKSAATDIRDKKKTLPVVYVLNHPDERYSAWQLIELYKQAGPLAQAGIEATLAILERTGARRYADAVAGEYYTRALQSLDAIDGEAEAVAALHELAQSLVGRPA
ncbi:MAG TPA: polyprenyl synthetase family protein [Anaerolineae bacterium]|nr:polyprenyl synthetase family protein [Anaerolineae bacterium]